jgi:hypothetical protein
MRKIDKKHNIAKANLLSEQRYLESKGLLNEMDYEREITQDDFRFLQKFPGWEVKQTGDSEFSITNQKYPRISFDVSIASGGRHQHTFGKAPNQEYPWKFVINAYGEQPHDPTKSGHQGYLPLEGGQTSNLEGTFQHFLKHTLPYRNR